VQALQAGAFDFIEKPFKEQYLLDRVEAAIRQSRDNLARQTRERSLAERLARWAGASARCSTASWPAGSTR
jgi:FixJ family two-component response regulator